MGKREKDSDIFVTDSGIPIDRLYGFENQKLGDSGTFPFTRGIYRNMFRDRLWTMREYTGYGSALDTNKRFQYLLGQGQTGLSVAFDLPTQLGLDSDDPRSEGEVGKVGVAISTLKDMQTLFHDIPIDQVSTSMTINSTASTILSMYIAAGEAQGLKRSSLRGTTQNDILKEYAARNTYVFPPEESFNLSIDLIEFCAKEMPKWHPISISGYHMREAGANAIQELAFTLANAIQYVKAVISRGLSIDSFSNQLSFFFACRNDFFEEIAKFRAARRIWARIVKERFGSLNEQSMKMKFHVQTSGESLTAQQPENNVTRVAIQALAAVLGGAQSIHTNSKDEALGLPTEEAVTIALRTQQIIAEETGVTKTVDPAGGSYYIESLTDELEDRVMKELDKIEAIGGALEAIKSGYIQGEIQRSAYEFQKDVDSGVRTIVGVNKFNENGGIGIRALKISKESSQRQLRDLKEFKSKRNKALAEKSLAKLENEARKPISERKNLMYFILEASSSNATTGEITNTLKSAYGEYHPKQVI
jgi:methylmalonyl-CoA mutase N-terminal domain/subunit